jgi:hypothetical protein
MPVRPLIPHLYVTAEPTAEPIPGKFINLQALPAVLDTVLAAGIFDVKGALVVAGIMLKVPL